MSGAEQHGNFEAGFTLDVAKRKRPKMNRTRPKGSLRGLGDFSEDEEPLFDSHFLPMTAKLMTYRDVQSATQPQEKVDAHQLVIMIPHEDATLGNVLFRETSRRTRIFSTCSALQPHPLEPRLRFIGRAESSHPSIKGANQDSQKIGKLMMQDVQKVLCQVSEDLQRMQEQVSAAFANQKAWPTHHQLRKPFLTQPNLAAIYK